MAKNYPGGFVTKSPVATVGGTDVGFGAEGGTASGMWTLDQAMGLKQQGLWPTPSIPKKLFIWGQNATGQLGDNTTVLKSSPVQVGTDTDWSMVATGNRQISAIKQNGTLWAWGNNTAGEHGDNTDVVKSSPVQIGTGTTWSKIGAGKNTRYAIKTDGTLWTWGYNVAGQMGDSTLISKSSPVQIGALTNWSKVAGGQSNGAAIKTDGTLWGWAANAAGQLGQNNRVTTSSPVQIGTDTNWNLMFVAGYNFTVIKTDGTLWAWGENSYGGHGLNDSGVSRSSPVQVGSLATWSKISGIDGGNRIAVQTNGTMWTWGYGPYAGILGLNDAISRSSPTQVGALTNWSSVGGGESHMLALNTSGALYTWGLNDTGQLGSNTTVTRSSPVQVGSSTDWKLIVSPSYAHTVVMTSS